ECEGVPGALEDVLGEEADAAVADAHGRGGEAVDILPVQEGVPQLLFGEQVRRFAIELSQEADLTDIGLLGTFSLATEWQGGKHVLTSWSHEIPPLESGRVVSLSKGEHRKRQGSSTADIRGVKALPRQRLT